MQEPENRRIAETDAWLRVPVSARPSDRDRFRLSATVEDDDNDEDMDFLKSLAQQAAREVPPVPEIAPARPRTFTVKADDALDVFKESYVERPRPRVLSQVQIDAIDMDDLLEQLSTTAAALRRRKAA